MPKETIETLKKEIALLQEELKRATEERDVFQKLSAKDPLTQLYNRGHMESEVPRMISRATRSEEFICTCFIDLNDFKQINDKHGHIVGDQALQKVAEVLKNSTRDEDLVIRFGGDEFIIFWTAPRDCADQPLQRIEEAFAQIRFISDCGKEIKIEATTGFYCLPADTKNSFEELLRRADAVMYANKEYKN